MKQITAELIQLRNMGINAARHHARKMEVSFYNDCEQRRPTTKLPDWEFPALTEVLTNTKGRVDFDKIALCLEEGNMERLWD